MRCFLVICTWLYWTIRQEEHMDNSARVAECRNKLVSSGAHMTKQRMLVLEVLAAGSGHMTANQVLGAVQSHYPKVNKTTVYRTLDLLIELGVVAMTHMGGNQGIYELLGSPHHHLICKECGKV